MLLAAPSPKLSRLTPVEVARCLRNVPCAPYLLSGLEDLLQDPSASMGEISRLVRYEPGLTAQLLRLRCEQKDGATTQGFTFEDAINDLGFSSVRETIIAASQFQRIEQPLEVYNLSMNDFWRRSVSTALAAELLAEEIGEDRDLCFTLGLLHNVGMLAVDAWARQEAPELVFAHRAWPREFSTAEGSLLGFHQGEVGSALLSSWDFPSSITEAIRFQYVPYRYGPHARRSCLLHAAKWLSAAVCTDGAAPKMPESAYLDVLRVPSYTLATLVVEVRVRLGGVRNAVETIAA